MIKSNQRFFNFLSILMDVCIIFASMVLGFWIRVHCFPNMVLTVPFSFYITLVLGFIPVQLFLYFISGLYRAQRKVPFVREMRKFIIVTAASFTLLLMTLYLFKKMHVSRGVMALFMVLDFGLLAAKRTTLRILLHFLRRRGYNTKHLLLVGSDSVADRFLHEIKSSPHLGYNVIGYVAQSQKLESLSYLGSFSDFHKILKTCDPDEVYAAVSPDEYVYLPRIIRCCEAEGKRFTLIPSFAGYVSINPHVDFINDLPLLNLRRIPLDNIFNAFVKRFSDIVLSALLILLTSPVMIVAAVGVKLSSPGPILFKQKRVGYDGKIFNMYKFRSMRINSQENTAWSTNTDSRRTPFGSFIRKYSIDELPQFFNVLFGSMSIIGPRPEVPYYVEQFKHEIPTYMVKHQIRPGITGWAQVNGLRGDTSIEERIKYDLYYIEHWSLALDCKIFFRTIFHMKNSETLQHSK